MEELREEYRELVTEFVKEDEMEKLDSLFGPSVKLHLKYTDLQVLSKNLAKLDQSKNEDADKADQ